MAEITKVTTPMIPRENLGSKNRPVSEQTFEINNPTKVNKPQHDNKVADRNPNQASWETLGKAAVQPLLRDSGDLIINIQKMISLLQMGISTSEVMQSPEAKELMDQIFLTQEGLMAAILQQDEASVVFKGETFHVLRDILQKFDESPKVKDALVQLLKTFDFHVNSENSLKTILYNCNNLLDYMFKGDRQQFESYLEGLKEMLLPQEEMNLAFQGEQASVQEQQSAALPKGQAPDMQAQYVLDAQGNPVFDTQGKPILDLNEQAVPQLDPKEAAQVLKGNLLPLLGEIVVKYHQNGHIRDMVMVVVHNIVRVDKGTPQALKEAVESLVSELKKVANLPEGFEKNLLAAMQESAGKAKSSQNDVINRLAEVISRVLRDPDAPPPTLRQAENLLLSLLQNQSSMMEVQHFVLPMQTGDDRLFAELYVDPDSDEGKGGRPGERTRKIFLTVDSDNHGSMEMSFLQTGERVQFNLWCPERLVGPLSGMRRAIGSIMQLHGYTMAGFGVDELIRPQTVAQVFPKLLNRKVGIDVRI